MNVLKSRFVLLSFIFDISLIMNSRFSYYYIICCEVQYVSIRVQKQFLCINTIKMQMTLRGRLSNWFHTTIFSRNLVQILNTPRRLLSQDLVLDVLFSQVPNAFSEVSTVTRFTSRQLSQDCALPAGSQNAFSRFLKGIRIISQLLSQSWQSLCCVRIGLGSQRLHKILCGIVHTSSTALAGLVLPCLPFDPRTSVSASTTTATRSILWILMPSTHLLHNRSRRNQPVHTILFDYS